MHTPSCTLSIVRPARAPTRYRHDGFLWLVPTLRRSTGSDRYELCKLRRQFGRWSIHCTPYAASTFTAQIVVGVIGCVCGRGPARFATSAAQHRCAAGHAIDMIERPVVPSRMLVLHLVLRTSSVEWQHDEETFMTRASPTTNTT